jgi:hypothetical protein
MLVRRKPPKDGLAIFERVIRGEKLCEVGAALGITPSRVSHVTEAVGRHARAELGMFCWPGVKAARQNADRWVEAARRLYARQPVA